MFAITAITNVSSMKVIILTLKLCWQFLGINFYETGRQTLCHLATKKVRVKLNITCRTKLLFFAGNYEIPNSQSKNKFEFLCNNLVTKQ